MPLPAAAIHLRAGNSPTCQNDDLRMTCSEAELVVSSIYTIIRMYPRMDLFASRRMTATDRARLIAHAPTLAEGVCKKFIVAQTRRHVVPAQTLKHLFEDLDR
jgi:hypothetical protein